MAAPGDEGLARRRVWDLPVRIVHWAFVPLIVFSWWSAEVSKDFNAMQWHMWSGYSILGLVIFRLYWGLVGSDTARFKVFVRGPAAILGYVRGQGDAKLGHSPLAALSVVAMLLCLAVQVTLGLFAIDEYELTYGPLASFIPPAVSHKVTALHGLTFNLLLALLVLHVGAVLFYLFRRKNLIGPMITGNATVPQSVPEARFAPWWRLLVGIVFSFAAMWFISKGLKFA